MRHFFSFYNFFLYLTSLFFSSSERFATFTNILLLFQFFYFRKIFISFTGIFSLSLFLFLSFSIIKNIINPFRLEKETKAIKDGILKDIKDLCEHEQEENYHQSVRVSIFWSNNYFEYKSNGDRNKTLSAEECLNKVRPYLKDKLSQKI